MSLWLNPDMVTFGEQRLEGVTALYLQRKSERLVVERSDAGPHATFADAIGRRVEIIVERSAGAWGESPTIGAEALLRFEVAAGASDAGRMRISTTVVLVSISEELSLKKGATEVLRFVAVSADGATDPVTAEVVR
ncbi:MAG: hypothetical protein KAS72_15705 [Phycisphaerales bacterium]|nr:hypothetical protein [Phycisphaerales bacterium]